VSNELRDRALKAAGALPVVAGVLNKTLGLYRDYEDLSIPRLAASLEQDVVITGTVLSIANSAMYGGRSAVSNVRQAIARIGMNKTRNVLLGLSVTRGFKTVKIQSPCWSLSRFNAHSLASATLSDLIVRNVRSTNAEWAFMAGLLHDIGLLVVAAGLPEQFGILMKNSSGDATLIEQEQELLGFTHFELGAEMASRWNCPVAVQDAARFCQHSAVDLAQPLDLGAVVKSATVIADGQSLSNFASAQNPAITSELLEALEIREPDQFIATFRADYNELQSSAG
jgi:putative nucleotidyltransferase with HDIG domain